MILVLCALAQELGGFTPRPDVDVIAVGVGPVEAAIGAARAFAAKPYAFAVNAGIAGGFRGRAHVGEAIVVDEECFADIGLEGGGDLHLPGGALLAERCASDAELLAPYRAGIAGATLGRGLTSATITTTDARAHLLTERFAATVESMEGFAVLRAAERAGIRAIEVRGVSNLVGDRAQSQWDFRAGASAAVRTLDQLLDLVR